jgi:GcrA cell cycle regulator
MRLNMSWTDERVELLKKLWTDGLSASQIASQLGQVTRNAVIGKVHRLGLSGRMKSSSNLARAVKPRMRAPMRPTMQHTSFGATALKAEAQVERGYVQLLEPAVIMPFPAPKGESITLMQLSEKTCRWPLGDPSTVDFRFCGCETAAGASYCQYHAVLAFQPAGRRKAKMQTAQ